MMKKGMVMALAFVMVFMIAMPVAFAESAGTEEDLSGCTVVEVDGETYILRGDDEITIEAPLRPRPRAGNIASAKAYWTVTTNSIKATGYMLVATSSSVSRTTITLNIERSGLYGWMNETGYGGREFTFTKTQATDYGTYTYKLTGTFIAGSTTENSSTGRVTITRYP